MLLNVFEPVKVNVPTPPLLIVQLNVEPPPINPLSVAPVMEIVPVPVPSVVVKLIGARLLNDDVLESGQTKVPPLNVRFFVPVEIVNLIPTVHVKPFKSNVPLANVVVTPVINSASCKVTEPLGESIVIG